MAIRRSPASQKMSEAERKQLVIALTEMKARGLAIPTDALPQKRKKEWHTDSNGYFVKINGSFYNPTPKHTSFINSEARLAAFIGGRGSGKSAAGAQKAIRKVMKGESGAVLNPDFENFRFSTWPELREWIPWGEVVPSQKYRLNNDWQPHEPFTLVFNNGARMYCKGLKDPDSARGPNINWLWYDEAGRDKTGMGWKLALGGVRIGDDPQGWVTTTPKGMDHWIYNLFVKQDIPAEAKELFEKIAEKSGKNIPITECFFATIDENKENLDPGFYAQMVSLYPAGWLRQRELEGQFVDEGGVLGDRSWFSGHIVSSPPEKRQYAVRFWDLAATEKKAAKDDPDFTVGTLLSYESNHYTIENQVAIQALWREIRQLIIDTALSDGKDVKIIIEEEPGAAGKNLVSEIMAIPELAGFVVEGMRPSGDKVARAMPWFGKAAEGLIDLVAGAWNNLFLDQLSSFPQGAHDDRIDSVSGCFMTIGQTFKWKTIPFLKL